MFNYSDVKYIRDYPIPVFLTKDKTTTILPLTVIDEARILNLYSNINEIIMGQDTQDPNNLVEKVFYNKSPLFYKNLKEIIKISTGETFEDPEDEKILIEKIIEIVINPIKEFFSDEKVRKFLSGEKKQNEAELKTNEEQDNDLYLPLLNLISKVLSDQPSSIKPGFGLVYFSYISRKIDIKRNQDLLSQINLLNSHAYYNGVLSNSYAKKDRFKNPFDNMIKSIMKDLGIEKRDRDSDSIFAIVNEIEASGSSMSPLEYFKKYISKDSGEKLEKHINSKRSSNNGNGK